MLFMNYINISFLILLTTSINAFAGQFKNSSLSEKLEFKNKCDQGEEVTISAVGDVLLHSPLQQQAFQDQNTYKSLWPKMIPIFKKFAISYANFEGPSAEGLGAAGRKSELGF